MNQSQLPTRAGVRPDTTATNPHSQLTDIPSPSFSDVLLSRIAQMPDVDLAPSMRAPAGTFGAYLKPEPIRREAIEQGWAEPHPLAGQPSVSPHIVMVYAPRDPQEVETVMVLVSASWC